MYIDLHGTSKWKNSIPHEESEVEAEVAQVEGEDEEVVNVRGHLALHHLSFAMSLGQICVTIRLPDGLENKNFVIKPVKKNLCYPVLFRICVCV